MMLAFKGVENLTRISSLLYANEIKARMIKHIVLIQLNFVKIDRPRSR